MSQAQLDAAVKALQDYRSKDVPGFEQAAVSDSLLEQVAAIVLTAGNADAGLTALQGFRNQDVPWYEQSFVTDELLSNIVSIVLNATKGIA